MTWLFAVLIVLLIGAVAVVAAGRFGDDVAMAEEYDDRPDVTLPADGPVTAADLRALRFTTAVRGYRASEVDALIDRLARQLDTPGATADLPAEPRVTTSEEPRTVAGDLPDWSPPRVDRRD